MGLPYAVSNYILGSIYLKLADVVHSCPKGPCSYIVYLGLKVGIWEPLWALSVYHIPTWTLWVVDPKQNRKGKGLVISNGFLETFFQCKGSRPSPNSTRLQGSELRAWGYRV